MRMDETHSGSEAENQEPSHPISISIIYEDAKSRAQAAKLCKRMANKLKTDFRFRLKWWHFKLLRDSKTARAATAATARADVVIVSARAGRELPRKVKDWMQTSLSRRKLPDGALVALIRMAEDLKRGATPVHNFLGAIARQAKMDYLPEFVASGASQ